MLQTAQLLPQKGFRRWASTRPVSRPSRQPATGPPGSYPDGTHTRWRRRASVGSGHPINHLQRWAHEEEHVEPAQPERLDREEVTLEDYGRLLAQELPPADARSPRCGVDAVAVENVPNTARRQRQPERDQLALDALVSPARVLRRQAQDQLLPLRGQRRSARAPARIGPAATDEGAMPAQQRRRLNQERAPAPRQQLAERRQQDPIGRPQARPPDLAPQHLQLMPQHQDLKLLRPLRTTKENQQLEQTPNDPVSEGQTLKQQMSDTHRPTLPARTTSSNSPLSNRARPHRGRRTSLWDPHDLPGARNKSPKAGPQDRRRSELRRTEFLGPTGYSWRRDSSRHRGVQVRAGA